MLLIVGLGNPGEKFKNTRHNIGFKAIDGIVANFSRPLTESRSGGTTFNFQSIFNAQISKGKINGQDIVLAKPQTFMNLSGQSIKKIIKDCPASTPLWRGKMREKLKIENLVVIHDDIDLPLGKIKIVKNRGTGGHKGVESIAKELKTKDFIRIRIGVNQSSKLKMQNEKQQLKTQKIEAFVLGKFDKKEEKIVKEIIKKTISAVEMILSQGLEKTMSEFNQ
ncbi:MAG: aminoacyl-tRNA hydrolase [Candidatus Nealsonbacteria bacterium CG23_combo_of_CG06-09_8_20_14_all_39_17]|uniref:Peptidyl-tRNA hydrolase n=1 Tax=Candidatus Nealsonbacteria bacterium CG23_combo_of_CG06-09_8_20_14_all_39_17 TaxID=1974722 RepID=A0A2G9YUH3_9BACT|nr:MAG: aminoacyl-tRNA hydrolase [Candidatus Nealsonbacteria bacterium CG23_combo_of_CG06-09_8_20_14_all_39_17]